MVRKSEAKIGFKRYPHIPLLISMKPSPRILLGQKLFWTYKRDGSCIALWLDKKSKIRISSRNLETASIDLQTLVKKCEDYPKIIELLKENPQFIIYVEACRKGRSVTGIENYERNILYVFDIYDKNSAKFLPYVNVHQHAYHHNIPCVKLFAETRHRSMKDLLKFKNHVLEYCDAVKIEGMVIKAYKVPERFAEWDEFNGGLIQAKVKLDVPEPEKRKIARGEAIYPPMPDNEVYGAISKVEADSGLTGQSKDDMPKIAQYVSEACKQHLFANPKKKLYQYYQDYLERMVKKHANKT
jgi:hypothetical protein